MSNMEGLLLVSLLCPLVATNTEQDEELKLPTGPAPIQVLARFDEPGKIAIKMRVDEFVEKDAIVGGQKVKSYENVSGVRTTHFDATRVQVFDTKGKRIDPKDVPLLLKREIPALVSADGREVDPLHLRIIKERIPILIVPLPKAEPAGRPPFAPPGAPFVPPPGAPPR